jgi:hypothetical protein
MSNVILEPLIDLEGYCCMHGYLKLCKFRGQKPEDMAKHMGVASSTIRYHYTMLVLNKKNHRCLGSGSCMKEDFTASERLEP